MIVFIAFHLRSVEEFEETLVDNLGSILFSLRFSRKHGCLKDI